MLLFENKEIYDKFVEGAWSAALRRKPQPATAARVQVAKFNNGVAVYHI